MPFKPGDPKPPNSGRKPGSMNKKTKTVEEVLNKLGFDPFDALCEMAKTTHGALKFQVVKEICQYVYPKKKALEITNVDPSLAEKAAQLSQMDDKELLNYIESETAKIKEEA